MGLGRPMDSMDPSSPMDSIGLGRPTDFMENGNLREALFMTPRCTRRRAHSTAYHRVCTPHTSGPSVCDFVTLCRPNFGIPLAGDKPRSRRAHSTALDRTFGVPEAPPWPYVRPTVSGPVTWTSGVPYARPSHCRVTYPGVQLVPRWGWGAFTGSKLCRQASPEPKRAPARFGSDLRCATCTTAAPNPRTRNPGKRRPPNPVRRPLLLEASGTRLMAGARSP